jgi:hypothetical protein
MGKNLPGKPNPWVVTLVPWWCKKLTYDTRKRQARGGWNGSSKFPPICANFNSAALLPPVLRRATRWVGGIVPESAENSCRGDSLVEVGFSL